MGHHGEISRMIRRLDNSNKQATRTWRKKIPLTKYYAVREGAEIDTCVEVIMPPYGERIRMRDRVPLSEHGAFIEIGMEDLLRAIREYRKARQVTFPVTGGQLIIRRKPKSARSQRKPVPVLDKSPKLVVEPPAIKKHVRKQKPVKMQVSDHAAGVAAILRQELRKKNWTQGQESDTVPMKREPESPKMTAEQMGVSFGNAGMAVEQVAQRYSEVQEFVAKKKGIEEP